jgi:hypothetical protein
MGEDPFDGISKGNDDLGPGSNLVEKRCHMRRANVAGSLFQGEFIVFEGRIPVGSILTSQLADYFIRELGTRLPKSGPFVLERFGGIVVEESPIQKMRLGQTAIVAFGIDNGRNFP